jgi:hypothetical protein
MDATRRELIKAIGVAPVAAPSAMKQLAASVASNDSILSGVAMIGAGNPVGEPVGVVSSLGRAVFSHVRKLHQRADMEFFRSIHARIGGVDPDIAALRSVSPVNKARMQAERDKAMQDVMAAAANLLWPSQ